MWEVASVPVDLAHNASVCALAVMAKAPRSGEVKTRLVPPLRAEEAAILSTCFLKDIAANFMVASKSVPVAGYIAYSPVGSEALFRTLVPPEILLLASRRIGLGHSLPDAAEDLLALGYGGACLVNSDSPTLPTSILVEAAKALQAPGDRVVLGPASDGGYYLIGLKQPHRRLFEDIAWSTDRVFRQTVERAHSIGLDVVTLPVWYDVDDATSLGWLCREVLSGRRPPDCVRQGYAAPDTSDYLRSLAASGGGERLGVRRAPIEQIPP
jgi:rSAM/selenodomain-associated transferase 1